MMRLIKLEWSKFHKNKVIVLLFLFFFIFFPTVLYFGTLMPELPSFLPGKDVFYSFPTVWDYMGYAGNWMVFFFLGVLVIYTITIEVSNKTMRQAIINGLSRKEFLSSKLINIILLSTVATVYYTILSLVVGFYNGDGVTLGEAFNNEYAIPRFFLMSFSYMTFAAFLAFLIRRSGIAVFLYLTYVLIIEILLRWAIHIKIDNSPAINYYPMNATEDLMPFPIFQYAEAMPSEIEFSLLLSYGEAAVTTLIYTTIFLGITYLNFMKRDI